MPKSNREKKHIESKKAGKPSKGLKNGFEIAVTVKVGEDKVIRGTPSSVALESGRLQETGIEATMFIVTGSVNEEKGHQDTFSMRILYPTGELLQMMEGLVSDLRNQILRKAFLDISQNTLAKQEDLSFGEDLT